MSSFFKSIYNRFSASLLDKDLTEKYALKIKNRQDINDTDVWSQLRSLEDLTYLDSSIALNDLKLFFKDYSEIEPCIQQFFFLKFKTEDKLFLDDLEEIGNLYLEDCQLNYADDSYWEKHQGFKHYNLNRKEQDFEKYELEDLSFHQLHTELKAKHSKIKELISKLKIFLKGKIQLRYLKNVITAHVYSSPTILSVLELPILYNLREYWDLIGSLKKIDSLYFLQTCIISNSKFLKAFNNGNKKNNRSIQFLN